jgi:hypothetical protein
MASEKQRNNVPPPPPKLPQRRNASNHMFMSPPNQDARDAWAADRWADGWLLKDIAAGLEISVHTAHDAVERSMAASRKAKVTAGERARAVQRARLERAHEAAMAVLEADHITVSNGRLILRNDEPIPDYDPILRTIDRIVKISESLRRLDGLDQPIKVDATVTEATQQDIELQEMVNEFRARNSSIEQQLRTQVEPPE